MSDAAGRADILVVPDIEAGNMLAKRLTLLSGAEAAGIILGAASRSFSPAAQIVLGRVSRRARLECCWPTQSA